MSDMTRAEALEKLDKVIEQLARKPWSNALITATQLQQVRTALSSCACGEPIAKTRGYVREICGDDGVWRVIPETFQDREWPKAVEDVMRWKAVIQLLLPAEETEVRGSEA